MFWTIKIMTFVVKAADARLANPTAKVCMRHENLIVPGWIGMEGERGGERQEGTMTTLLHNWELQIHLRARNTSCMNLK